MRPSALLSFHLIYPRPALPTMEAIVRDPKLPIGFAGWPLEVGAGLQLTTQMTGILQIRLANDRGRMK
jgi:hypothetical protein